MPGSVGPGGTWVFWLVFGWRLVLHASFVVAWRVALYVGQCLLVAYTGDNLYSAWVLAYVRDECSCGKRYDDVKVLVRK